MSDVRIIELLGASEESMAKSEIRQFLKEISTKLPEVVPLIEKT